MADVCLGEPQASVGVNRACTLHDASPTLFDAPGPLPEIDLRLAAWKAEDERIQRLCAWMDAHGWDYSEDEYERRFLKVCEATEAWAVEAIAIADLLRLTPAEMVGQLARFAGEGR